MGDLRQIVTGLELYYSDNGFYPSAFCESTPGSAGYACWATFLPAQYIGKMPSDPTNTQGAYGYYYASGNKPLGTCTYGGGSATLDYLLATRLENPTAIPNSCATAMGGWDNVNLNYIQGQ